MIADRRTLGLDSLSITDIDIVTLDGIDYIALTEKNSKIVLFRYTEDNSVEDVKVINVEGYLRQFVQTSEGTWLIASEKYII